MKITFEQEMELAKFPEALRVLIQTELAFGNAIVEVGHSFPAPPAGAYIKLANKVSTRARDDGDGLRFYDRDNSSYSGEFTDAKRFYFVLEPPNPPPAELGMDTIRRSLEPKTPTSKEVPDVASDGSHALSVEESATGATRVLQFRDKRPPHEVQFALEREIRTLFTQAMEDGKLCMRAKANVVGADYDLLLRFEAALTEWNCYSLRADAVWGKLPFHHAEYYRKTSGTWFAHWTGNFTESNRLLANEGSAERYRQLCEEALNAEEHLDSVAAIQQAILSAMKEGARFCDSHKEGGTHILWRGERFVRSDYGDYPGEQHFTNEIDFLKMLRQFCHWDVTRSSGKDQLSEFDTWRLILRQMTP